MSFNKVLSLVCSLICMCNIHPFTCCMFYNCHWCLDISLSLCSKNINLGMFCMCACRLTRIPNSKDHCRYWNIHLKSNCILICIRYIYPFDSSMSNIVESSFDKYFLYFSRQNTHQHIAHNLMVLFEHNMDQFEP